MVESWLPDVCLISPRAAQPMTQIVDEWAAAWFKRDKWQVLGGWDEALDLGTSEFTLLRRTRGMEIKGAPDVQISLATTILSAEPNAQRSLHDDKLLRQLGARAIEDLDERISQSLPERSAHAAGQSNAPFSRGFSLLIGTIGKSQIAIECSGHDLATMARRAYPPSQIETLLSDRESAIEQVPIKCAALLGRASITLREIADLEEGDLLLLDSKPGDLANLMIEGRPTALAGSIVETPTSFELELQDPQ